MTDEEARAQLRERQGAGARYDSVAAPAQDLILARRGTAYFARKLNELSDAALDAPSLVPGWSRRYVVADVGYHARGLARLVEAARQGRPQEILSEPENQREDVAFGATLPAHALRYLFHHSEVHLNVEWRDLDEAAWRASVRTLQGVAVSAGRTPWLRARAIWQRAVDLDNGGSYSDFPPELLDALRDEAVASGTGDGARLPGMILAAADRDGETVVGTGGPRVSGTMADIVRWLCGRGARRLSCTSRLPDLPANPVPARN
ncbi:maleylpyruvate isomerase N-terminal domain-containing protein [Mesorhizobium sp. L-8-10]|uniref:maleylpyruvate isomerase N-terminal domain-containing protein n=1 Tax=Mesorhizobium sp. L-8-10 TaxID=2744523 RepID=UPI0019266604|nr:maleylpyruvate isomerase family mycothiol-dependent enzyme [Mesorhizobium sp. L-8-10]